MIKNIILLTKISTRNFFQNFDLLDKKTKRINKKSMYVWLIVIVMIAITYLCNEILNMLEDYGQIDIFLDILFTFVIIIMFMQTIIASMNILYFSKDIEYFLPFPIKPVELLLSKVNTILNVLYSTELIFMLIPLILYGISTTASLSYYIFAILVMILLPIFPAVFISIVTLIIMTLIKRIKNKNKFQIMITLFFIIAIILLEVLFTKTVLLNQFDYNILEAGIKNISESINNSLLIVNPLISILKHENIIINLLEIFVIYAIMYATLICIGRKVYIKNILKATSYNKNKKSKQVDFEKQCKPQKVLTSYIKNDFKNLLKNAIFFMQTIYPICLLMLMFIVLTIYFKLGIIEKNQELSASLGGMHLTIEGVCILLGISQVLFSIGGISISAISRQGKNAVFMKYIPVSLYKQFILKNIPQVSINIITSVVVLLCAKIIFTSISLLNIVCIFLICIVVSILNSYLMLIVDIKRPILDWNAEIEVLKQNGNKIFQYVWTIIIVILLLYITKIFKDVNLYIAIFGTFIIFGILLLIVDTYVRKQINKNKLFKKII